jgi:amidohydrolase
LWDFPQYLISHDRKGFEMKLEDLKKKIQEGVEFHRHELIDLALKIHNNPELSWEEVKASGWLCDFLAKNGFKVERGICDLPTAFKATYGTGKPTIAMVAEYDALPDLGHACGHNIIGVASIGAAIAAKFALDQHMGTITVMGCPAEEVLGGKVVMVEKGAFGDVDVAMMVHPDPSDTAAVVKTRAAARLEVEFFTDDDNMGVVNALDALILSFNNINLLKQSTDKKYSIQGIITDGGKATNIVLKHASAVFMVRTPEDAQLDMLCEKVLDCFKAAALSTGARFEHRWTAKCYVIRSNTVLARLWKRNMEALGREVKDTINIVAGSDMANVSFTVPSIHPHISLDLELKRWHTPESAAAAASETGMKFMIDGAKSLAMTAADIIMNPEVANQAKEVFVKGLNM